MTRGRVVGAIVVVTAVLAGAFGVSHEVALTSYDVKLAQVTHVQETAVAFCERNGDEEGIASVPSELTELREVAGRDVSHADDWDLPGLLSATDANASLLHETESRLHDARLAVQEAVAEQYAEQARTAQESLAGIASDARDLVEATDGKVTDDGLRQRVITLVSCADTLTQADTLSSTGVYADLSSAIGEARSDLEADNAAWQKAEDDRLAKERAAAAAAASAGQTTTRAQDDTSSSQSGTSYDWSTGGTPQAAIDAGSLVTWAPGYLAADINSSYGSLIRSLGVGSRLVVNGRTIVIDGEVYGNYNTDYVDDMKARAGWPDVMIQTCLPSGGGAVVAKYGHYV